MTIRSLAACALCLCVGLAGCGGGTSSPAAPSTPAPTVPTTPTTPTNTWSIAGRVVDTVGQQPLGGVTLTPSWGLTAVTSDAGGSYSLGAVANPPTTPYMLTATGTGMISREIWVNWIRGARTDLTLDLIRDSKPFSMEFYRQFVRGTYDNDGPWRILRWPTSPKFYVKTVDENGRPIEPEVLAVIADAIARAVPAFTGNTLTAAAIESGTASRPQADGWINVDILRKGEATPVCGRAYVGAMPGQITLYDDICACGSRKIPGQVVMHEVGHALGFFHVPDRDSMMYPYAVGSCPAGELSAMERYHSAIAYSRPRGNTDPDNDPSSGGRLGIEPRILVLR